MLRRVLGIMVLHLRIVMEPGNIVSLVALPLLFTFLIGLANQGDTRQTVSEKYRIAVENRDTGRLGNALVAHLSANPLLDVKVLDHASAQAEVARGDAAAMLTIPPEFSRTLLAHQNVALDILNRSGASEEQPLVQEALRLATDELLNSLHVATTTVAVAEQLKLPTDRTTSAGQPAVTVEGAFQQAESLWQSARPIAVAAEQVNESAQAASVPPQGTNQSSPGMLVMFSLFYLVNGGAVAFIEERQTGTLQRLLVLPQGKASVMLGKLLGIYVSGLLQIVVLILAGIFIFHVNWGRSPAALALVALSFALSATSLGLLIASLVRSNAQAGTLSTLLVLVICALGGAWWPLEVVPRWMRQLGHAVPTAWAIDGFQDVISRGQGVEAVLPNVLVLAGFAAAGFALGLWRFRYD